MRSTRLLFLALAASLFTTAAIAVPVRADDGKLPGAAESSEGTAGAEGAPVSCSTSTGPQRKLTGVVTDPSGAAIPNAHLTLTCGDSFHAEATSSATGAYTFIVPAGAYLLGIEAPNFGSTTQQLRIANTDTATELNAVLRVGQVSSAVTVSAGNAYAVTESSGGTKTDLPLNEVPQAISIVNRDLMNSQNVVKLDDALKNVAGVMPGGYYDGWDYYRIRGFDASFNTYIDGLRGGNGMMEETWGLESVEVLKGPSSALYGQSVLGGIVNIVTRKPVPDRFIHAQLNAGSFNFVDPAIDMGGSLNSSHTLYGRLAALYHSSDSYVNYAYRHRYYFAPSLTWKPRAGTTLTLIGRIQRDNGRNGMPLPALGTALPNINGPIAISTYDGELEANANKLAQANRQFGVQLNHSLSEHFTLRENARFAWYTQDWNRIYYPSYLDADQRTLYRYPLSWHGPWQTHEADTSVEARGSFLHMDHSALLGVDFYRNPTTARGYSIDFSNPVYEGIDLYNPVYGANPIQALSLYTSSDTVTQYTGIYLQDHIRLPKSITVTAGGRMDLAKNESKGTANQNDTGLTPRIGVTWQAIPSTTVYASFSKSFLPQSGMVYDGTTTGHFIAPERGQQWEGGIKSAFLGNRLMTTVAIFQLNRGNVSTSDPGHPNFYLVTGQQRSRGVELEATVHPLAGWNITSAYSYINAIVTDDTSLAYGTPTLNAPKNIFSVWSTYEVPRGPVRGLGFGIGGRHYTTQGGDLADSFQLPGYGVVDASMTYRRGPTQWQVNANNLGNKRYWAGSYSDVYVKPGEPRVIRGTVSWNF
ncbi:MAG: TonB-dependent siderophore receptor [Edaphobacter sp.]|uniref:TonB-dependent siderophore receptor n=1 Tax=Edaphobacter sp. TaxID=1934404 RepID=UPI002386FA5D|nr:TonB-dependent siderophore receptor [Edaphobacter sp.]MDE1178632.1 TonB-dependent siderophore receptor [Edaphobacter sp.]